MFTMSNIKDIILQLLKVTWSGSPSQSLLGQQTHIFFLNFLSFIF